MLAKRRASATVTGGDDVCLHGVVAGIGRHAGRDAALEERKRRVRVIVASNRKGSSREWVPSHTDTAAWLAFE